MPSSKTWLSSQRSSCAYESWHGLVDGRAVSRRARAPPVPAALIKRFSSSARCAGLRLARRDANPDASSWMLVLPSCFNFKTLESV